jgi:hypothetical protein
VAPSPATCSADQTPLTTDKPDSITELFARYPQVTDAQVDAVIAHLREVRKTIGQDQKPLPKPKAPPKAKASPKAKLTADELKTLLGEIKL